MSRDQHALVVEPWCLRETRLDLDNLARMESLFAVSNGHIGLRGNLDEGEPSGVPGTYLNGVHERRPLPYAEAGYGFPEDGQTIVNVADGKLLRVLVDDEPLDVRYGELHQHERTLDFKTGVLSREVEWSSPAYKRVRIRTWRMVSLTQRAIAAFCMEIEPVDDEARVVVQSGLVANEDVPVTTDDPRVAAALQAPLEHEMSGTHGAFASMVHHTRVSGQRIASAMDHESTSPNKVSMESKANEEWARTTISTRLKAGETLRVVKYVAYGWSHQRSAPALRDQVAAALTAARDTGWEGLLAEQQEYLADFWDRADVVVTGDPEMQQAVRFALFHVLQSAARAERRSVPAKGLTGPGYDGHCFWDSETFVLPVLSHTVPDAAADVLRWRHSTLDVARERARQLGLAGAAFPWRTIDGAECSGYWPAGTAAFHINADIAHAVVHYIHSTGDLAFEREVGLELLVETARLWRSLGSHDRHGRFRIDGVTGPDEYSAIADNNVFTNLMAAKNMRAAAEASARHHRQATDLGVDAEEAASWRDAAGAMLIPYDEELGVHPQSEGFTDLAIWDFEGTEPEHRPLFLHYPYFDIYRKQVLKQADLVLAIQMCGDAFSAEQKRRDFEYYEALTMRDSSLSSCTQAVVAAEVGHLGLAYDYASEAAFMDLRDIARNTGDGLHMASLAGAWIALVQGFGGLRDDGDMRFAPALPEGLDGLSFGLLREQVRLRVEVTPTSASYTTSGGGLTIYHYGEQVDLVDGETAQRGIDKSPKLDRPRQPVGCEPQQRDEMASGMASLVDD